MTVKEGRIIDSLRYVAQCAKAEMALQTFRTRELLTLALNLLDQAYASEDLSVDELTAWKRAFRRIDRYDPS